MNEYGKIAYDAFMGAKGKNTWDDNYPCFHMLPIDERIAWYTVGHLVATAVKKDITKKVGTMFGIEV